MEYRSKDVKAIGENLAQAIVIVFINVRKTMGYARTPSTKRAAWRYSGSGRIFMVWTLLVRKGQSAASCARVGRCPAERATHELNVLHAQSHTISPHCVLLDDGLNRHINNLWENECGCSAKPS